MIKEIGLGVLIAMGVASVCFPIWGYFINRPARRNYGVTSAPAFFVDLDPATKRGNVVPFGKRKVKP